MYENTRNSIDWKGLFLKVVIAFLIVLIAITGYKTFKNSNKTKKNTTTTQIAESNKSTTFTANIAKLKEAGEKYFNENTDKKPVSKDNTTIVTLNELIKSGTINNLTDEDGKNCDGESSYVTATLEGEKIKLKANLVCGDSSSYSIVYMGENDNETKTETKTSNSSSEKKTSTTTNTSTNTTTNNNKCTASTCTPVVNVSTKTEASQSIVVNNDKDKTNTSNNTSNNVPTHNNSNSTKVKYYTVEFDKNGGTKTYRDQEVKENGFASYPGENYKSGYSFKGWYLDGKKYDFNTPVTEDIELIAKYERIDYEDIDDDYNYNRNNTRYKQYESTVYTMGWDYSNVDEFEVTHTLKVPEEIEELDIKQLRIAKIEFSTPIDSNHSGLAQTYRNRHKDTFFYSNNDWENHTNTRTSLASIKKRDVNFYFDDDFKNFKNALREGFEVTWRADDIYESCDRPFTVYGPNYEAVNNVCNYGIVYVVTWEYIEYK